MGFWTIVFAVVVGIFVSILISVIGTVAILYTLQRAFWGYENREPW